MRQTDSINIHWPLFENLSNLTSRLKKRKRKIQGIETCYINSHPTFIYSILNDSFSIVWINLKIQESETLKSHRLEIRVSQITYHSDKTREVKLFRSRFRFTPRQSKAVFQRFLDPHCVPLPVPQNDPNFSCTLVISQNLISNSQISHQSIAPP